MLLPLTSMSEGFSRNPMHGGRKEEDGEENQSDHHQQEIMRKTSTDSIIGETLCQHLLAVCHRQPGRCDILRTKSKEAFVVTSCRLRDTATWAESNQRYPRALIHSRASEGGYHRQ